MIAGWAIDTRPATNLVLYSPGIAVEARKPSQKKIHCNQATQFSSWAFTSGVRGVGLVNPTGTLGEGYDNAMIESFGGTMQVELGKLKKWRPRLELANAFFQYIDGCYNQARRHSQLNWEMPTAFESKGVQPEKIRIDSDETSEPKPGQVKPQQTRVSSRL